MRALVPDQGKRRLQLPAALRQQIQVHAREVYPEECCGVLLGSRTSTTAVIKDVVGATNEAGIRRLERFLMDPRDLLRALRVARSRGQEVLGFYHSHPSGESGFSQDDVDGGWTGASALVLPLNAESCLAFRSFYLGEDRRVVEEAVES